jgi:hypothetical protein
MFSFSPTEVDQYKVAVNVNVKIYPYMAAKILIRKA